MPSSRYILPEFEERTSYGFKRHNPYTKLFEDRIVFLGTAIDDQVAPEWTTEADGPHKRKLASVLTALLKSQWAPHGLVQRSQGKWYPGEPLPRWQIGLHWRRDGEPLWYDEALLADPWAGEPGTVCPVAAEDLLSSVASDLGLPGTQVRPAYEDPLARLSAGVRRPVGAPVDPDDELVAGAVERRRVGLRSAGEVVGTCRRLGRHHNA